MSAPAQLPLALAHLPDHSRDSFIPSPANADALALIDRWPAWPSPVVVLSGPAGSGKTHLAQIWAARAGADLLDAELLEDARIPTAGGALVVEDVGRGPVPERALFHLMNSVAEAGAALLITSRQPAATWPVHLPDLHSRLRLATPAVLAEPDEPLLRTALTKLFADRQLLVDKAVIDYLLLRMERSMAAAVAVVEALDREALARGRRITARLAAGVLASENAGAGEFSDDDRGAIMPEREL